MLADSIILNIIQDSEVNQTCIEHPKILQYDRQTKEHVSCTVHVLYKTCIIKC